MRYHVLCTDYDGTLAHHGAVSPATFAALERLAASGRKAVLVTGRVLDELRLICPRLDLFACVVAENGALLYWPQSDRQELLAEPPPAGFADALRAAGATRVAAGRVVVATWTPHETTAVQVIHELGLGLQVILNKDAVMVLPAGVDKASGLARALHALALSPHEAVAIGDAENDFALLRTCECSVAVANAVPALREAADVVTSGDHGRGVTELIDQLLADDLAAWEPRLVRHRLEIGRGERGEPVRISPYAGTVLLTGPDGARLRQLSGRFLQALAARAYTYCALDPDDDFGDGLDAVRLGTPAGPPPIEEVVRLLRRPGERCVLDVSGIEGEAIPAYAARLAAALRELHAGTARPHWLVIGGAERWMPAARDDAARDVPPILQNTLLVTTRPQQLSSRIAAGVRSVLAADADIGAWPQALRHAAVHGIARD